MKIAMHAFRKLSLIKRLSAFFLMAAFLMPPVVSAQPFPLNQCAADRAGTNLNCTAADVTLTSLLVAANSPAYCIGGTSVELDVIAEVQFGSSNRYDIGVFLSADGKSPQIRSTAGGATSCTVSILPPFSPFQNIDGDACGDGGGRISGTLQIDNATVFCTSTAGSGGNLNIPYVISWELPNNPVCTSAADPVPTTSSKCNAPTVAQSTVVILVMPSITKNDFKDTIAPGE